VSPDMQYFQVLGGLLSVNTRSENMQNVALEQNYPNPVKDYTTIKFKTRGFGVRMELVDIQGRVVKTIVDKELSAGQHEIKIYIKDLSPGTYAYVMKEGSVIHSKKLIKQ